MSMFHDQTKPWARKTSADPDASRLTALEWPFLAPVSEVVLVASLQQSPTNFWLDKHET